MTMLKVDRTRPTEPVGSLLDLIGRANMDPCSAPARRIALLCLVLAALFGLPVDLSDLDGLLEEVPAS